MSETKRKEFHAMIVRAQEGLAKLQQDEANALVGKCFKAKNFESYTKVISAKDGKMRTLSVVIDRGLYFGEQEEYVLSFGNRTEISNDEFLKVWDQMHLGRLAEMAAEIR